MANAVKQVERGAALLDAKAPGWEDKVDLACLNMKSASSCILGQIFGRSQRWGFQVGLQALEISHTGSARYGFYDDDMDYGPLKTAWCNLIMERRAAQKATQENHALTA